MASAAEDAVPPRRVVALDFSMQPIKAFFNAESNHALLPCKYAFGMHSTYGQRLEQALALAKKDRQQLADAIGISVQAVSHVILGKTKALTAENTARAAKFAGVDGYWLATGEGSAGADSGRGSWPFKVAFEDYARLSDAQKQGLEAVVSEFIKASLGQHDDWGTPSSHGVVSTTTKAASPKRSAG